MNRNKKLLASNRATDNYWEIGCGEIDGVFEGKTFQEAFLTALEIMPNAELAVLARFRECDHRGRPIKNPANKNNSIGKFKYINPLSISLPK